MSTLQPFFVTSELLTRAGFRHAFSLRTGGVSPPPFHSLNFGGEDHPEHIAANLRIFTHALMGVGESRTIQLLDQVHGARVVTVSSFEPGSAREQADALVAISPGIALGIRVADCIPLLAASPDTGEVAAIHAGWRGIVAGVILQAIERLRRAAESDRVIAALGPSIGPCCFEVGSEVADTIAAACGSTQIIDKERVQSEKRFVNLRLAARLQLRALGVQEADIEDVPGCTKCDPSRFFSFRRDGAKSGRHIAVICSR